MNEEEAAAWQPMRLYSGGWYVDFKCSECRHPVAPVGFTSHTRIYYECQWCGMEWMVDTMGPKVHVTIL